MLNRQVSQLVVATQATTIATKTTKSLAQIQITTTAATTTIKIAVLIQILTQIPIIMEDTAIVIVMVIGVKSETKLTLPHLFLQL